MYSRACNCAGAELYALLVHVVDVMNVVRGPMLKVVETAVARLLAIHAYFRTVSFGREKHTSGQCQGSQHTGLVG